MKTKKEYPIYDNFDMSKPIGKVVLFMNMDWDKVAITESIFVSRIKKGRKMTMGDVELHSFAIIPRCKRINYPIWDKRFKSATKMPTKIKIK